VTVGQRHLTLLHRTGGVSRWPYADCRACGSADTSAGSPAGRPVPAVAVQTVLRCLDGVAAFLACA
jgi:hypothetical protein